jgi:hypothetical protein
MSSYLKAFGSRYFYVRVYTEKAFVAVLFEKWALNDWWVCSDFFQHGI